MEAQGHMFFCVLPIDFIMTQSPVFSFNKFCHSLMLIHHKCINIEVIKENTLNHLLILMQKIRNHKHKMKQIFLGNAPRKCWTQHPH